MKRGAIELAQVLVEQLRAESEYCLQECNIPTARAKDTMATKIEGSIERILRHQGESEDWSRLEGAVAAMKIKLEVI